MSSTIYRFNGKTQCNLAEIDTANTSPFHHKEDIAKAFEKNKKDLAIEQGKLYATGEYSFLVILQGLDTAGKDGVIRHVFSGLNPEAVSVHSFKEPSTEDLKHDYLWRAQTRLPRRGDIGIFNRSYYEEVLVVQVHNMLKPEHLPQTSTSHIWEKRYHQIVNFETYLNENGIIPIKFFLHISKKEQKKRLLDRLSDPSKNWKFSENDVKERAYWNHYQVCYEDVINHTSTEEAPWYVIPADKKWYAHYLISDILTKRMKKLKLNYPETSPAQKKILDSYLKLLETDDS